jgi:hypothetical protein
VEELAVRIVLLAARSIRHGSFLFLSEVPVLLNWHLFFTNPFYSDDNESKTLLVLCLSRSMQPNVV